MRYSYSLHLFFVALAYSNTASTISDIILRHQGEVRTDGEGWLRSRPTGGRVGRRTEKVSDPLGGDVPE